MPRRLPSWIGRSRTRRGLGQELDDQRALRRAGVKSVEEADDDDFDDDDDDEGGAGSSTFAEASVGPL